MQILSHRGFWREESERNTRQAFCRSWELGFGLETDVRDLNGALVISHDPPKMGCQTLDEFLSDYERLGKKSTLALNIKSNGLTLGLMAALAAHEVENYFVFDMSVPDTVPYLRHGASVYARLSEYEPEVAFLPEVIGIWVDMFENDWLAEADLDDLARYDKRLCLVSPELHRRNHREFWQRLRRTKLSRSETVSLCTDFPLEARRFFLGD